MVILGVVIAIANDLAGKPVSEDAMLKVMGALGAYIVGQGIADHGSQGKKAEVVIAEGEEEGPNWEDTTDIDDDSEEKKELLG